LFRLSLTATLVLLLIGCTRPDGTQERKAAAQQYFRGVYGCDSSVVDRLCADDIAVSYPVFQKLFNTPVLRGRDAVRHFASGFCSRWTDATVTFHDVIADSNNVVLVWSFQGRNVGSSRSDVPPSGQLERWGGITLIRFNEAGRIEAEVGEESEPGPFERMQ